MILILGIVVATELFWLMLDETLQRHFAGYSRTFYDKICNKYINYAWLKHLMILIWIMNFLKILDLLTVGDGLFKVIKTSVPTSGIRSKTIIICTLFLVLVDFSESDFPLATVW